MLSLITGFGGLVGTHLCDYLQSKKINVVGTYLCQTVTIDSYKNKLPLIECDIRDQLSIISIIRKYKPATIYHLAAQSYPPVSWQRPADTLDINIIGTVNICEAVKLVKEDDSSYDPVIVIACSSAQYGASQTPENSPVIEETPFLPLSPYGVSKVAQDLLGFQYYQSDNLRTIRARIFNTTGPRKVGDVTSDFTLRAVQVERGLSDIIKVGNIETRRAITDVRDMINALFLLAQKGKAGEAYNISGEKDYKISDILGLIKENSSTDLKIEEDTSLLRPTDEALIIGDSSKLIRETGWKQVVPIEQTVIDMMNYWREQI